METLQLLITARDQRWSPEAIFIIGCCGGIKVPGAVDGCVCVANKVIHYNRGKIEGKGDMNWKPKTDYSSKKSTWCRQVLKAADIAFSQKKVPHKAIDRFLSGDHVVKSEEAAEN